MKTEIRKIISIILLCSMILSLFRINIFALSDDSYSLTITADKTKDVKAGDTVKFEVVLNTSEDVMGARILIKYDPSMFSADEFAWDEEEYEFIDYGCLDENWWNEFNSGKKGKKINTHSQSFFQNVTNGIIILHFERSSPVTNYNKTENMVVASFYLTALVDVPKGATVTLYDPANDNFKSGILYTSTGGGIYSLYLNTSKVTFTETPYIIDSGVCGDNLTWTFDSEGTLTISGTGEMNDYSYDTPWSDYGYYIESVTINSGVKTIGSNAFCGFKITSIEIPDSVTSIGDNAFCGCTSLTSIEIPDSVTSIVHEAFYACYNLTKITIPDSVKTIGSGAFALCESLTSITIPDSVTSVGDYAFWYCENLTDVFYGGSEENWNNIIGDNNGELTNATIHYNSIFANKLTKIHNNNGKTVNLPEGAVLNIGENLNFRNGYVKAENGYVKAGDKKITGNNIYFTDKGKIRMGHGYSAKVERDNSNGTTDQGFVFGILNPTGNIRMILEVTGETSETDYTGRTITKDFDFSDSQLFGLVNIGFTVNKIPKPLSLEIKSVE